VIEKCFDYCSDETRMNIIKEITHPEIVFHLLFDNYGNYVLQKALAFAHDPYYTVLIRSVAPHLERLKYFHPFGTKLFAKLVNTYPEFMTQNNFTTNDQVENNYAENRYMGDSNCVNNVNTAVNNFNKRSNRRSITNEGPRNARYKQNKFASTSNGYQ